MRGDRRALIFFVLAVLLLGAVTTIAVAWGCRWVTDERREARWDEYANGTIMRNDANPGWGTGDPGLRELVLGGDGRQFLTGRFSKAYATDWYGAPQIVNGPGVEWIGVMSRDFVLIEESNGAWQPKSAWTSPDPSSWAPVEPGVVPWWSSLEDEPLVNDGAVIEMGIGWPVPAFLVTHRLPRTSVPWAALKRSTIGATYGFPFGRSYRAQLPSRPFIPGFVMNTLLFAPIWGAILGVFILGPARLRSMWRRHRLRCGICGYSLKGTSHRRCSECGATSRTRRTPWGLAAAVALGFAIVVAGAEFVYARSVMTHPQVPVVMRLAYDGDLDALKRIHRDRPGELYVELPDDYHLRHWSSPWGGISGRIGTPGILVAATCGEQLETVQWILDVNGVDAPPRDGVLTRVQADVLAWLAQYGSTAFITRLLDQYGWLVDAPDEPTRVAPVLFRDGGLVWGPHLELVIDRMRIDSAFHDVAWDDAVHTACRWQDWALCLELASIGPPATESTWRRDTIGVAILNLFTERDGMTDRVVNLAPFRFAVARALARSVERVSPRVPQERLTIGTPRTIVTAMALEDPRAHAYAIRFLQDIKFTADTTQRELIWFWYRIGQYDVPFRRLATDWDAVSHLTVHLDPNVTGETPLYSPPLRSMVHIDFWDDFILFMLDHGADVSEEILFAASDRNRADIDAWLVANGEPVHVHTVRFPKAEADHD